MLARTVNTSFPRAASVVKPLSLVAVLSILFLAGCGQQSGSDRGGRTEIRFAHAHAPDTNAELHFTAATFAETVKSLSGRLDVKVYSQATLGSEREVYEGLQVGSGASLTVSGSAILNNFDQRVGVLDLPYLWKDYDHVHRVLDGEVGRELAADLEKQGLVVLAWLDSWGWRNVVTTQKPVRRPEELRGLKIRTIPTPMDLATLSMMGANPTPMTYGEIYTGLQTGVIDGFEQASAIIVAERFYEVTRHMALTRHLFGPLVICYSKVQWDRLSAEDQAILRQAALLTRDRQRARGPEREAEAMAFLRERGMNIYDIDVSGFEQAAIQVQDRLAAERGATDLLRKIRAAAVAGQQ
jgi:tripartite ATP-independent transporter DctP family solute receptor